MEQDRVKPDVLGRYHDAAGATFRAPADAASGQPGTAAGPGAVPLVPDALDFLRGTWRVQRRVADHAAGRSGTFDGVARFEALDDPAGGHGRPALAYLEQGELRFGGHRGPASRSLIYRGRADGTADVCFADGREFYRLDPRSGSWQGRHECGLDHYAVAGRLLGSGMFEERWQVRGPAKDYEITTRLVRAEPGAEHDAATSAGTGAGSAGTGAGTGWPPVAVVRRS